MLQPIRILIIEDEILIAQDLKEILEEVGYTQVFRVNNYQKAIDFLAKQPFDLVLLDINLNDSFSGIDIAKYINQNQKIPFIYITSYSDAETIANVKQTKPSAFLLKPYNKSHLLASIEIALFN
jgi:two-component system response regulator LytT